MKRKKKTPPTSQDDGKPPSSADQAPKTDNDRNKKKEEFVMLKKSLLQPMAMFAKQLYTKPAEADKIVKQAQKKLADSPRMNINSFRQLMAKIYDPDHLKLDPKSNKVEYSTEFKSYFALLSDTNPPKLAEKQPDGAKVVTPAKAKRNQPRATATATQESNGLPVVYTQPDTDDTSLSTLNLDNVNGTDVNDILQQLQDRLTAADTPRTNNLSMTESQIYENEGVDPLGDRPAEGNDEESKEDEWDDTAVKNLDPAIVFNTNDSTISSLDEDAASKTEQAKLITQQGQQLKKLTRDFQVWKQEIEKRLTEKDDTIAFLEDQNKEKAGIIEELKSDIDELETRINGQELDLHAHKEKLDDFSGTTVFKNLNKLKKETMAELDDQEKKVRQMRYKFTKDFSDIGNLQRQLTQQTRELLNKEVRDSENEIYEARDKAMDELKSLISEGIHDLQRTVEQEVQEATEEASQTLDAAPAYFQEVADEAIQRHTAALTQALATTFATKMAAMDSTAGPLLKTILDKSMQETKRSIMVSMKETVDKEVKRCVNEASEALIKELESTRKAQTQIYSDGIVGINLEQKEKFQEDIDETAQSKLRDLLTDELAFETNPIAEFIAAQVLEKVTAGMARDPNRLEAEETRRTMQEEIDGALSDATKRITDISDRRALELEKKASTQMNAIKREYEHSLELIKHEADMEVMRIKNESTSARLQRQEANEEKQQEPADRGVSFGSNIRNPFAATGDTDTPLGNRFRNPYSREAEQERQREDQNSRLKEFKKQFKAETQPQPILDLGEIEPGYVIPIQKNLQGHPEGPRLWNKHIDKLLCDPKYDLNFKQTTHEPCLYYKYDENNNLILMLRQVDDFLIAGPTTEICNAIRTKIQGHMKNKLNDLGTVQLYNGIDIDQTRDYIKLSCESYIDKIVEHHGWTEDQVANLPIPMRSDSQTLKAIQETEGPTDPKEQQDLQTRMKFSYRQAIGELIYAMSTCRVDIAAAVIQLSQYSAAPAEVHYKAVKQIFLYLYATKDHGLYYWQSAPRTELPAKPHPVPITDLTRLQEFPDAEDSTILFGATDATWAADRLNRRSVSGIALLLSGAVVYYRCQIQPTVALSSTESEFAAMADAGKAALYIRSILDEIGLLQKNPTKISADNRGALCLANAQQPTRRTKHIDIKQMAILQWTEEDMLNFEPVPTQLNFADSITKSVGRIKFYEQNDVLMGRRQPKFAHPVVKGLSFSSFSSTYRIFTEFSIDDCLDSASVGG